MDSIQARELAVWRLSATLGLSFGAGLLTQAIMQRGWLGPSILRTRQAVAVPGTFELMKKGWIQIKTALSRLRPARYPADSSGPESDPLVLLRSLWQTPNPVAAAAGAAVCSACSSDAGLLPIHQVRTNAKQRPISSEDSCSSRPAESGCCAGPTSFKSRLVKETLSATWMVGKFMALAFLLEGLITLYVPARWISGSLGAQSPLAILAAAMLGVPAYTTSLTALPMIGGLLTQGMNPAAALAFLVAGPTTTLPAMAAVWPLVSRRVFVLYVSFSLLGAAMAGYAYCLVALLR